MSVFQRNQRYCWRYSFPKKCPVGLLVPGQLAKECSKLKCWKKKQAKPCSNLLMDSTLLCPVYLQSSTPWVTFSLLLESSQRDLPDTDRWAGEIKNKSIEREIFILFKYSLFTFSN